MLAKKWNGEDPTGWYMSEKLDGIRALWAFGFSSRNNKPFIAPDWFTETIPMKYILDGELWMGRGRFNETSGQVRRKKNQDWAQMKYMVFDYIEELHIFSGHLRVLKGMALPPHVEILPQIKCISLNHLLEFEAEVLKNGGEGVMLRHPDSKYQANKRSKYLLKVKQFHNDEAIVVGSTAGEGKYKTMAGALLCDYKGNIISVGTGLTDEDRLNPPIYGAVITFKYFEMSKDNIPRFPVYIGIRDYE